MTTGTSPDSPPGAARRAAEVLGVREDASPAEARRAYLRKVRANDYLPPRPLREALRVFDGGPPPTRLDVEWLAEDETRLRADVAQFAQWFFILSPARRREHWDALFARCRGVAPLAARLQALKGGLDVECQAPASDQSRAGQLAEHLLRSFPLPPVARAASRQAFLLRVEESPDDHSHEFWERAARRLRAERPAVVALDEELVRHVAQLRRRLKRRAKVHRDGQRNRRPAATAGGQKRTAWWLLIILVGVASGIMRGLTSSNSSSHSPTPSPSYSAPSGGPGAGGPDRWRPGTMPVFPTAQTPIFNDVPPISDLLDPSKYDVGVVGTGVSRILQFTPRVKPAADGPAGRETNGRPVFVGEAMLRLRGVSAEHIDALYNRATKPAEAPHGGVDPKQPKPGRGDEQRP